MRKILTYISTAIICFGMFGFLFNSILLPLGILTYNEELPITDIQGIIEKNKKIYIGLGEYNRIQVYNSKGKYTEFIKTSNHSKAFDFKIDENNFPIVNVIYTRDNSIEKYIQEDESEYRITNKIPLIIEKIDSQGKSIKIEQPLHMSFWGGSINCWLIGFVGIIIFFSVNGNLLMEIQSLNLSKEEQIKELFKRIYK